MMHDVVIIGGGHNGLVGLVTSAAGLPSLTYSRTIGENQL
jgi:hypothetical protein